MIYAILFLVAFIGGVLCSGYVVSVVYGIKTDIAQIRTKAMLVETDLRSELAALKAKL